jgi:hypothetical protein
LVAVVFADRQRQVGKQVHGEPWLVTHGVGNVLLRRGASSRATAILRAWPRVCANRV